MPSTQLYLGCRVIAEGRELVVRGREGKTVFLEDARVPGLMQHRTEEEIAADIAANRMRITAALDQPNIKPKLDIDLTALNPKERDEFERRYAYVAATAGVRPLTKAVLDPVIRSVAESIGDSDPPHWNTLYRWRRAVDAAGGDLRVLVPAYWRRGNRHRRLQPEVLRVIDQEVRKLYLTPERRSAKRCWEAVRKCLNELNRNRPPEDQLVIPSLKAVHRHIEALDHFEITAARYGKRTAEKEFTPRGKGIATQRPLERVEIDHTKLDLCLIDLKTQTVLGRPWLTVAIDDYSRMIVGFYISFDPPGWASVMRCLRQAIWPKDDLAEAFPDVERWPCYGTPETIVVDNGREFHSSHFEMAAHQLGMQIQYTTRRSPWLKGKVERIFRTINEGLLQEIPGRTFSNVLEKGEYDPEKVAVMSMEGITECMYRWITEIYANDFHRGINSIPLQRWRAGVEAYPVRIPISSEELQLALSKVCQRAVHHYGVEIMGLRYNSHELASLRRRNRRDQRFTVKYDPADLGSIWVLDPKSRTYITVPAVDAAYAAGLSEAAHKIIRDFARAQLGAATIDRLIEARERIRDTIFRDYDKRRRTGPRQKVARYEQIDSRMHARTTEAHETPLPRQDPFGTEIRSWQGPFPDEEVDEGEWEVTFNMPGRRAAE